MIALLSSVVLEIENLAMNLTAGAVETAENGCGGADHQRQLRTCLAARRGRYVMCFDFLVDLSSEVLDKNIVIYVIDVALSIGGVGFY